MTTVSVFKNYSVTTTATGRKSIKVQGQEVGTWDRHDRRAFDKACRVLAGMAHNTVVWVDEAHHTTYPSGTSGTIRYGRSLTLAKGVGPRKESNLDFTRAQEKGLVIRPTFIRPTF